MADKYFEVTLIITDPTTVTLGITVDNERGEHEDYFRLTDSIYDYAYDELGYNDVQIETIKDEDGTIVKAYNYPREN